LTERRKLAISRQLHDPIVGLISEKNVTGSIRRWPFGKRDRSSNLNFLGQGGKSGDQNEETNCDRFNHQELLQFLTSHSPVASAGDSAPNVETASMTHTKQRRDCYGSAAGCEAMAVPRRLPGLYRWAAPLVRAWPAGYDSRHLF
jgi:hypothetical protein